MSIGIWAQKCRAEAAAGFFEGRDSVCIVPLHLCNQFTKGKIYVARNHDKMYMYLSFGKKERHQCRMRTDGIFQTGKRNILTLSHQELWVE